MSNVNTIFLPWARQGMAARFTGADPLSGTLPGEARLSVALDVNGTPVASMPVRVSGPADVIGLDPRQVVRTEPPAGTADFESNNLAAIEFDNPDLPWMFTPAAPGSQGRLRPWLCLVVVRKQPGVRLRPSRGEPLPVLEIAPPAVMANELPDLAESWAWAHVQLSAPEGSDANALGQLIATRPELSVSRLLSPRLLTAFTEYIACVVPAFDAGRRAGLGEPVDAAAALQPAWASGAQAPAQVSLPVYYHWEFQTGAREDFESMVAKLVPRDLSASTGRRAMDITQPGFPVPQGMTPAVQLEGALQPVDLQREAWPDQPTAPWQLTLQSIVNAANARSTPTDAEPVLGPPIYGRWYARRHEVGTAPARTWLDQLNLDPRERVVAALGTRVIQQKQEELMAQAWEQAGELARVNQRLRQMQLSLLVTTRLHTRHIARMNDDDALWRFASPAQSRLVWQGAATGTPMLTMQAALVQSSTPPQSMSAAMRRLARPRGAIARRGATAIRVSGIATATAFTASGAAIAPSTGSAPTVGGGTATVFTGRVTPATLSATTLASTTLSTTAAATPTTPTGRVGNFFHVFAGQPQILIFIQPTRGLVSFDAITRRLPQQHAGIVYARATDGAVASMARRPDFTIGQNPFVVTGGIFAGHITGAVLDARFQPTRARPRPGVGEPVEPIEPPEPIVRPTRPRPDPRPLVDSADAQAFRAAAIRHLAIVNPAVPIVFVPLILKPALDAEAARVKVQALLDPGPAVLQRMTATIRVAQAESAPRTVGPIGYSPTFPQPMSEALAALSQDWLLPGLERVPPDTAAMLEPNPRFIEAFMLGLNVEMGRELLWRDYPEVDERATYFRRFWRAIDPGNPGDINVIADWGERALGANGTSEGKQVVLLVRSGLVRRYPNAAVYAVPAVPEGNGRKVGPAGEERHPIFRGSLQPDVSFFGFALDSDVAVGNPGWYFVIQEQPTEPRFGFDVEIDFGGAPHVPLAAPPAGHALPSGTEWARNAAHMARITRQQPVRVAIHASELLRPAG